MSHGCLGLDRVGVDLYLQYTLVTQLVILIRYEGKQAAHNYEIIVTKLTTGGATYCLSYLICACLGLRASGLLYLTESFFPFFEGFMANKS